MIFFIISQSPQAAMPDPTLKPSSVLKEHMELASRFLYNNRAKLSRMVVAIFTEFNLKSVKIQAAMFNL
jgi:hypothetical protein